MEEKSLIVQQLQSEIADLSTKLDRYISTTYTINEKSMVRAIDQALRKHLREDEKARDIATIKIIGITGLLLATFIIITLYFTEPI